MRRKYASTLPTEWRDISRLFDALGDSTRQRILLLFEPGEELGIKQIASTFALSRTSVVFHLEALETAGLLLRRKVGRDVLFRFNKDMLVNALERVVSYVKRES